MQTPGPGDLPAVRITQAAPTLVDFPDLFLWICHPTVPNDPPFNEGNGRVGLPLDQNPIFSIKYGGTKTALTLGKQDIFWENKAMPTYFVGALRLQSDWDFDMSFVRDPRFPHADPRSAMSCLLVRGSFQKMSAEGVI
jgi:hypothetical protein